MLGVPLTAKLDHSSINSMACLSSCPELLECVSYALHELQMTDITLKAEQRSVMEAIYNIKMCLCGYLLAMERVCVIKSCHSSWTII